MGNDERWYFTKEQLENSPSRQCGIDSLRELTYRQQAANFIKDVGHNLKVSQLCVNTAIVYMHRFYVFHSFTHFPWHSIAAAALFLAAKVEEQPRKVEYVVKVAYMCKNHKELNCDVNPEKYQQLSQDLVFNENVLLQTLGFDVAIDHPHTHIVRCCHLVKAGKDLAHTSYFMASNSLHLTTMCLQYKPTVVACVCIHVACKWSQWEIPLSNEKKEWFSYVDPSVTPELLQRLTEEFLVVFDQCPSRLREKALAICGNRLSQQQQGSSTSQQQGESGGEPKKVEGAHHAHRQSHHGIDGKSGAFEDPHKHRRPHEHGSSSSSGVQAQQQRDREREYREKKERERLAQQQHGQKLLQPPIPGQHPSKQPMPAHHYHHRSSSSSQDPNKHQRPLLPVPPGRQEPRDILKEAAKDIGLRDYRDPKREPTKEVTSRDLNNRDHPQGRGSDKVMNNYQMNYGVVDKQRMHTTDANKVPPKHEQVLRRHDDIYLKNESEIKKHLSASVRDKNISGMYANKNVPPQQQQQPQQQLQQQQQKLKSVPKLSTVSKQEVPPPQKKPSLFSPEKSPPPQKKLSFSTTNPLASTSSSSGVSSMESSLELRPVMQKIDQQHGFEQLSKDASIRLHRVPEIITPITDPKPEAGKDVKMSEVIPPFISAPLVNGIETNPTLISNLLKEAPSVPHLPAVAASSQPQVEAKPHKKKNKEKHKHKDKERSREEKEKKKKHKDKDREKHKHRSDKDDQQHQQEPTVVAEPIKLTIQKDRIQLVDVSTIAPTNQGGSLKIKIPKDKIKTAEPPPPRTELKIKIPKEVIGNFDYGETSGKKRERERGSPTDAPPVKTSRKYEPKQNGRHSHGKVAQLGDGEQSQHRLAESKYIKNSS